MDSIKPGTPERDIVLRRADYLRSMFDRGDFSYEDGTNLVGAAIHLDSLPALASRLEGVERENGKLREALEESADALDLLNRAMTDSLNQDDTAETYPGHATINAWEAAAHKGHEALSSARAALKDGGKG